LILGSYWRQVSIRITLLADQLPLLALTKSFQFFDMLRSLINELCHGWVVIANVIVKRVVDVLWQ